LPDDPPFMEETLTTPEGRLTLLTLPSGRRRVSIHLNDKTIFVKSGECETAYPVELIRKIMEAKPLRWVCDEIVREESPGAVYAKIKYNVLGYLRAEDLSGKRILDFGSGCGASTMNLCRIFRDSDITGIELLPKQVAVAEARRDFYGYPNLHFILSPENAELPPGPGEFDYVNLNAVYEHLLPSERRGLLPKLWGLLKKGGILFISETPYRYSLFEVHTTGLPLINFLPDFAVNFLVRRLSIAVKMEDPWTTYLRNGIRGGSEGEIMRILGALPGKALLLDPGSGSGYHRRESYPVTLDEFSSRYRFSVSSSKYHFPKKAFHSAIRRIHRITGLPVAGDISLAIQKGE